MRITELFTAKSIALDVAAPDQAAIIDRLVALIWMILFCPISLAILLLNLFPDLVHDAA